MLVKMNFTMRTGTCQQTSWESRDPGSLSVSHCDCVSRHGFFSDPHVHHHHNGWIEVGIVLINTKFLWWDYYYWRSTLGEFMTLMLQLAFPSNSFHIDSLINFNDSTFTHFKSFTFTQVETTFTLIKCLQHISNVLNFIRSANIFSTNPEN